MKALEFKMEKTAARSKSSMAMAVPAALFPMVLYTNHNALVPACVFMYV